MYKQAIIPSPRRRWRTAWALLFVTVALLIPQKGQAAAGSPLTNGSFEQGFTVLPGCATTDKDAENKVGTGWGCFTNRGAMHYGFHADAWAPVVADGQYSQLIELNTWGMLHADNDRIAGIYQTVPTVPGALYRLSLRGMIRTTELEGDPWRYRIQVGVLQGEDTNWKHVTTWHDAGWNQYYPRTEPGVLSSYQIDFHPQDDHTTIFIRVLRKWGLTNGELDVNLDAIQVEQIDAPAP